MLHTPRNRFYFCRHCPPYVVEASDGRLYYFDTVQIGMQLTHLCSRVLIRDHVVQALHPYAHMFVQNAFGGRIVCMPRTQEYYDRLRALPPEDALTEHLESARLTLCAGYLPHTAPFHPNRRGGTRNYFGEACTVAKPADIPLPRRSGFASFHSHFRNGLIR